VREMGCRGLVLKARGWLRLGGVGWNGVVVTMEEIWAISLIGVVCV